jgi:hypothetical protein
MGQKPLTSEQISQPDRRENFSGSITVYRRFWIGRIIRSTVAQQRTADSFGWIHPFKQWPKINSVRNFDIQVTGPKCSACLLSRPEGGIHLCSGSRCDPDHGSPIDWTKTSPACALTGEGSRIVCGFRLRAIYTFFHIRALFRPQR